VTTTTQQDIKVQGGPWYGMMLVEEEAWNTYVEEQKAISDKAEVDVQKPYDSTVYVARQINAIKVEQKFGPDGSFEMEKEGWLAVIKALPLKGLSDGQNSDIVAGTIYNTALAWMNQTPACGSGSQSGVSGIPLPTSGPLKIGDILAYKGHNIPLTQQRWANAVLIVDVGKSMGVPERGQIIALATAIVELNLLNGQVAVDHDSVGLFQQRPASGWGTKEQVGDAIYSSRAFYGGPTGPNKGNPPGLLDHAGWEAMEPGVAAQDVQVSAYPGKYAEAIPDAAAILATIKESNATYGVTQSTPVGWFPIIDSDSSPLPNGTPSDTSGSGATTTTAAGATTTTAAGATTTGGEATTTTVAGTPATPARVLLIGDSLTDGAKTAGLPSEWTVDAKVGRPTSEAPEIVTKEAPNSDAIIIALGTNDYTSTKEDFAAKIKSVMDMVGTTKQVQWVNVDTGSTKLGAAKDGVNAALTEATSTYPNLKVADWDAAAKTSMEGKRADDGIHYTVEGYKVYAEFLKGLATGLPATPATDCSVSGGGDGMIVNIDSGAPVAVCPIGNAETNCQMVPIINQLIADAAADGVPMAVGNSYRSVTLQIELRKKHCGTSQYAIYEMPSGSCRPPTAKPGQSQHQKGLAIDWANCSTRATACYKWLAQNAAKYGLKNLPSESWHWSTTGS
jgi:lysophospholipase L1-like esterase